MKNFLKYSISLLFVLMAIFAFTGCEFGGKSSNSSSPTSLKISNYDFTISINGVQYSECRKELVGGRYVITAFYYDVSLTVTNKSTTESKIFDNDDLLFWNDDVESCNRTEGPAVIDLEKNKKSTVVVTYILNLKDEKKIQTSATASDLSNEIDRAEFNNNVRRNYAPTKLKCSYQLGKTYEITATK